MPAAPKVARVLPFSFQRVLKHLVNTPLPMPSRTLEKANNGSGRHKQSNRFHRQHRLVKHQVVALLKSGARFNRGELGLKLGQNTFGQGRIAIAVPKRILKFAVDRNRVKRVIREQFRQHQARMLPVDMLVTLQRLIGAKNGQRRINKGERGQRRETLTQLLCDVSRRFSVVA